MNVDSCKNETMVSIKLWVAGETASIFMLANKTFTSISRQANITCNGRFMRLLETSTFDSPYLKESSSIRVQGIVLKWHHVFECRAITISIGLMLFHGEEVI